MATKARHKKTAIQLWVADNRKAGGYTSKDLAGWAGVTMDTARGWESRGRPSEDAIRILERRFGKPAPDGEDMPSGQADLASAIAALVEELRERRQERVEIEGRLQALEATVELLTKRAGAASPKRSVPDGTAG